MRTRKTLLVIGLMSVGLVIVGCGTGVEAAPVFETENGRPAGGLGGAGAGVEGVPTTTPPVTPLPSLTPVVVPGEDDPTATEAPATTEPTPTAVPESVGVGPVDGVDRSPASPKVYSFGANPSVVDPWNDVLMAWDAQGELAMICPYTAEGEIRERCIGVPLSGWQAINLGASEIECSYQGFILRVVTGEEEFTKAVPVRVRCD
ncbi:MAG: hypothetical protein GYB68_15705 [Chloroflexi bacterium]|nr:hypothetical protein [Chloroflexota bacterium]